MPNTRKHLMNISYHSRQDGESGVTLGSFWLKSLSRVLCSVFLEDAMQVCMPGCLFIPCPAFFSSQCPPAPSIPSQYSAGGVWGTEGGGKSYSHTSSQKPNPFNKHCTDEVRF